VSFLETIESARAFLSRNGRVSLRILKREFDLDDDALEELTEELVDVQQVAAREGKVLSWIGSAPTDASAAEAATQAAPTAPAAVAAASQTAEGERRQLTVMFCDLVGSTELSERLDPEELREVVGAYQSCCTDVIHHYDGTIAQYLGDGILVYFGYPQAHENDAERALRAGLEIVAELEKLSTRLETERDIRLAVRVGIHTGPVVVGQMGGGEHRETLALGETTNLAARLQDVAEPGSVVVSADTKRLAQGFFLFDDLGTHALKGLSDSVPVYRVLRPSGVRSRLDVAAAAGLTPLVGREQELGLLLDRWDQVQEGMGNVVHLSGDAGIGKSRLIQAFQERLRETPHTWLELRCSPFARDSALQPILELLQAALAFIPEDSPEQKIAKLEGALTRSGFDLTETVPLFAPLLALPLPEEYSPPTGTPEHQKRRILQTLLTWLLAIAKLQPMVLLAEDLHWADPSTLELLGMLGEQVPTAGMLVLLSHRPDFEAPWSARSHLTPILLTRLTRRQVAGMLERIAQGKALPDEVVREITAKADGVPLFVEEITKAVLESGLLVESEGAFTLDGPLPELAIPATLQDSLMARLDRLSPVKELAQLCAVLGREFSYELLRAVQSGDEAALRDGLAQLLGAELLYQRGRPPHASYVFKHALIQETAYQSLIKGKRQHFHRRIAEALAEKFSETAQNQPEFVAHHYAEAALPERALDYWQQAGQRAVVRSANVEAVRHLNRGLAAVATLPEGPERAQKELALRTLLGIGLIGSKGYTAEELERNFERARELCGQIGETPQLFRVLYGLWLFYFGRAQREDAVEAAEQMFGFAERSGDPALRVHGHYVIGATAFYQGNHACAEEHLSKSLALYDPVAHRSHAVLYGRDPAVLAQIHAGLSSWYAGHPDRALASMQRALALARELSHPLSLAWALIMSGNVRSLCGEPGEAEALAEECLALAQDQGLPMVISSAMAIRGWTQCQAGREAIPAIEESLTLLRNLGGRFFLPQYAAILAELYWRAGMPEKALERVEEGLVILETNLDRFHAPELHRWKGEILATLSPDGAGPPEACFETALAIAREQGARSLELRAAMSLARLRQRQGKNDDAHSLLAPVYEWFTEGFDTADLRDAKELLEALT
jgi:TOMM system kinase/cyclase fusion protein